MDYSKEQIAEHHKQLKTNNSNMVKWDKERESKRVKFAKSEALKKKKESISDKVYKENKKGDFSHHPVTGEKMSKVLGRNK